MIRPDLVRVLSWGLKTACGPDHRRFLSGLDDVGGIQERLRQDLIRDLATTAYGRHFADPPLASWEDLEPWLIRQINGKARVIACDAFVHVEPTSGSSGGVKRVPYTRAMMGIFARMFRIWAADLLAADLKPKTGRIFISQSPRGDVRRETQYLGGVLETLLSPFLLRLKHDRPFLDDVATTLLAARDLEIISVWSPSYLSIVLDHIDAHGLGDWRSAWPRLQLISCWDEGQAAPLAADLRARFPGVRVQGKGLLSTEAPLTVPIEGVGCLPMYQDIYFEFLRDVEVVRLTDLREGDLAEAIITTPSGLVRYRTGDLVRMTGRHRACPILAFEGRAGLVSDLVGEKLSEAFVRAALTPLIPGGRFLVVPAGDHYILLSDAPVEPEAAERALATAHHYQLAREQGQLGPLEMRRCGSILHIQKAFWASQGQDFGHIKDMALISDPAKARAFLEFIEAGAG